MIEPNSIEASVNGQAIDPCQFTFHYQKHPYPGGHTYRFVILDAHSVGLVRAHFTKEEVLDPPRSDVSFVFSVLNSVITFLPTRIGADIRWFANTVSKLTIGSEQLIVEGECSPLKEGHSST